MRLKQAKCGSCERVLEWTGMPSVEHAGCPYCGTRMSRTNHRCQYPRITQTPPRFDNGIHFNRLAKAVERVRARR